MRGQSLITVLITGKREIIVAQRVQVMLIDDVDGTEGAETVTFALDGVTYEVDLSEKNAAKLRDAVAPWVGHGRRVSGRATARSTPRASSRKASSGGDSAAVREWARSNGHPVSERGRISATVTDAYAAAH